MPSESELIGAAEVQVDANTAPAEAKVAGLMGKIQQIGNNLTGSAQSGFVSFGSTAASKLDNATRSATALSMAMGPESPLSRVAPMLSVVSSGFDHIATAEQQAESQGRKFVALTPALTGVGIAVGGIGLALTQLGAPLQRAQASFKTAVENTGQSVSDYQDQLDSASKVGKQFGFNTADITAALGKLTVQTKDPAEAFKELNFTETLAAATHTDLSKAADQVGRMHAGMFRSLRQFGIYLPQLRTSADGLAKSEQALAAAGERLGKAQQAVADFQAKADASMADAKEKAQARVATAQQEEATLETRYNDLKERYATEDREREDRAAQAVEDSTQRQTDALQSLQDIRDRMDSKSSQSQETQMALADAEMRLNSARVKVASTSGEAQQNAIEAERSAQEELTRAKLRAGDQAAQNQRDLQKAQEAVSSTTNDHTKAVQEQSDASRTTKEHQDELVAVSGQLTSAQEKLTKAQDDFNDAGKLTIAQQIELRNLNQSVADAADKQAEAEAKVAEQKNLQAELDAQFQRGMEAFMQKEQGLLENREHTWAGHVAKLKAYLQDLLQNAGGAAPALLGIGAGLAGLGQAIAIGKGIGKLGTGIGRRAGAAIGSRFPGGQIEEELQTFSKGTVFKDPISGKFKSLGKEAEDAEKKVSKSLKTMGKDAKELETLEQKGGKVAGMFTKISTGVSGMGAKIASSVSGFASAAAGIAAAGWTAILPWLPFIALAAAVVAAGYLIYRNWDTIKDALGATWDWIFDKVTKIWGGIEDLLTGSVRWVKDNIEKIAFFFLAGGPLGLALDWMLHHWNEVWDSIKKGLNFVRDGILDGIKALVVGVISGVTLLSRELAKLPGPLGKPFKMVNELADDVIRGISDTLDALKSDGGAKAIDAGMAITQGIAAGMISQQQQATDAALGLIDTTNESMQLRAGISSPAKLFADEVGYPIAQGVIAGINRGIPAVRMASQGLVHVPGIQSAGGTAPFSPVSPGGDTGGSNTPTKGGKVIGELHQHFHQEISPMHAAAEVAWSVKDLG